MANQPALPQGHIISLTLMSWGHTKAACAFFSKLVRFRPVYATILTPLPLYDKITKEIDVQFIPEIEDGLKSLIRVVGLETSTELLDLSILENSFVIAYKKLLAGEPIAASPGSDIIFDGIRPPQLILLDFFLYKTMQDIRSISGKTVPIYALQSASATAALFLFGPEYLGGNGDLLKKLEAITFTDENAKNKEAERIYRRINGQLITLPGIPPMYDHEHSPQTPALETSIAFMSALAHRFFNESDGAVMNATPLFEGPAIEAFKQWFGDRPIVCPAPLDFPLIGRQKSNSPVAVAVEAFLDAALEKHGPNSVIYFSFGSVWWTTEPGKVWAALDVLIELGVPFVCSYASPFAEVPDDVLRKIESSGLGYASKWLPQTEILSHKACGWFISHCGHNSVMESLSQGVPLICWPFDADQPANAANIAFAKNLGYELFETRSGSGLRPIYRLGNRAPEGTIEAMRGEFKEVITKARGEDGKIKRANAQAFRDSLAKSWEPDGECWQEIKRIADVLH